MSRKPYSIPPNRRRALLNRYLAGEKIAALCAEFGVSPGYPTLLAQRNGYPTRKEFTGYGTLANSTVSASFVGSAPL